MASKTKSGIVVTRSEMTILELASVEINHNLSVEEMIGYFKNNDSDINSHNFPNVTGGQLGIKGVNLFLARPVPRGDTYFTAKVLTCLDEAGFVPEDLPALSSLNAKQHADELWEAGVGNITTLGEKSHWRDPNYRVFVPYLVLDPGYRGFRLDLYENGWSEGNWFIVRRK